MKVLGENLRRLRIERGYTQQQLAQHVCVDRTSYTKYESGVVDPSYAVLLDLCRLLGTTPNDILGWESE